MVGKSHACDCVCVTLCLSISGCPWLSSRSSLTRQRKQQRFCNYTVNFTVICHPSALASFHAHTHTNIINNILTPIFMVTKVKLVIQFLWKSWEIPASIRSMSICGFWKIHHASLWLMQEWWEGGRDSQKNNQNLHNFERGKWPHVALDKVFRCTVSYAATRDIRWCTPSPDSCCSLSFYTPVSRNISSRWPQNPCGENWAALSCDTKIKFTWWFSLLRKSFYTYIFHVQLIIMYTALDLLTQCFLVVLFVQTGNQHIYQPVGKQGNRHNSKVQL